MLGCAKHFLCNALALSTGLSYYSHFTDEKTEPLHRCNDLANVFLSVLWGFFLKVEIELGFGLLSDSKLPPLYNTYTMPNLHHANKHTTHLHHPNLHHTDSFKEGAGDSPMSWKMG